MDFIVGLLGVAAAIAIPVSLQRKEHPRRELRYAITFMPAPSPTAPGGPFDVRVLVWSTSRADIPSAMFDAGHSIVFKFSAEVGRSAQPIEQLAPGSLRLASPTSLSLEPQLIHPDFTTAIVLTATAPFSLTIRNPLIDIPIVRDLAAERPNMLEQQRAVTKSKARAHISFLAVSTWVTVASFVLFTAGLGISFADEEVGRGVGIPGMLGLPIGIVLLFTSGIKRLLDRRTSVSEVAGSGRRRP